MTEPSQIAADDAAVPLRGSVVPSDHVLIVHRAASVYELINRSEHNAVARRRVKPVNIITEAIIGDAIAVHREMGPGLLESTYEACLAALLARRGLKAGCEVGLLINFNVTRLVDSHAL